MKAVYKMHGTCANTIKLDIENGIVQEVQFSNGCDGNLKGISKLIAGMNAKDVAERLRGIKCGYKNTSCPDQLAKAIEACLSSENRN